MAKICISYRRADSQAITGRIFDRLIAHYGKDSVFIDIDNIPAGTDFRQYLNQTLLKTTVLLAIVGPKWLGGTKGSVERIHDENDPVRVEIETALYGGVSIIPVLIGNRKMPTAAQVPPSLKELVFINAVTVDPGVDFDHHMQRLIRAVDAILASRPAAADRAKAADPVRRSASPPPGRQETAAHAKPADDRAGRSSTKEREQRAARASAELGPPPARTEGNDRGALFDRMSWLRPGLRLPFVAGAAVLGLGLLVLGVLALTPSDPAPAGSMNAAESEVHPSGPRASPDPSIRRQVVLPPTRNYSPPPVVMPRQQ
ncbi:MAG TPA: toll/interleukin-1 receptor domain-containing protein [Xanthobacteraceae bacterium]|nr:toll/interleukin-1 receptor domain-containing protein [Xanthobacteraceae bacterium]